MGDRDLPADPAAALTRGLAALLLAAILPLPAQGPVYREQWGYLHLENRRFELLGELRARTPEEQQRVALLLAEPDGGIPFAPVAKALAELRGVPCDEKFLLRTAISVFVLPEVADPEGDNEDCRHTNVSIHLPMAMPLPGKLAFDVEVQTRDGERLWSQRLETDVLLEDLRMARPVARIPAKELPDGTYLVHVSTIVDGAGPAAAEPRLSWLFHVQRGYQRRCEATFTAAREALPGLDELSRHLLQGIVAAVSRAWHGEAFEGPSDALDDLLRLERALGNVAAGEHVLHGITGDVPIHLPTGDAAGLPCIVRTASGFGRKAERRRRPLVVFAGAVPSYEPAVRRPTAPSFRGPRWLALEMAAFGSELDCDVAFLASPGERRDYGKDLTAALAALRQLLGTDQQPLLLVGDRESAAVIGLRIAQFRERVAGIVLIGAGGMTAQALDSLGPLPVRLAPLLGHPGAEGLRRSLDYVATREREGLWKGDVALLAAEAPPWPFGVPMLAPAIESFAARLFAR